MILWDNIKWSNTHVIGGKNERRKKFEDKIFENTNFPNLVKDIDF